MEIKIYADAQGYAPFEQWLNQLPDRLARANIRARLTRLEAGNFGDCKPLREGVQELRINHGAGYRVYLTQRGLEVVILLAGGDKRTQSKDIEAAIEMAKQL